MSNLVCVGDVNLLIVFIAHMNSATTTTTTQVVLTSRRLVCSDNNTKFKYTVKLHPTEYVKVFGCRFYHKWVQERDLRLNQLKYIYYIYIFVNDFSRSFENIRKKYRTVHRSFMLSSFYFGASAHNKRTQCYYKCLTPQEQGFFKGKGYVYLCEALSRMIEQGTLTLQDHITLEASGGHSVEDMKNLVVYYKSLSFQTWTLDTSLLQWGYTHFGVPMITTVADLFQVKKG